MAITRKQFLQGSLATAAVGAIGACGDETDPPVGPASSSSAGGTGGDSSSTASSTSSAGGSGGSTPDPAGGGLSGGGGSGGGSACAGGASVTEYTGTQNHGSGFTVPAADVVAAVDGKTYVLTGSAAHTHDVVMTMVKWDELKATGATTVDSTGSHVHTVTITCD